MVAGALFVLSDLFYTELMQCVPRESSARDFCHYVLIYNPILSAAIALRSRILLLLWIKTKLQKFLRYFAHFFNHRRQISSQKVSFPSNIFKESRAEVSPQMNFQITQYAKLLGWQQSSSCLMI